MKVFDTLCYHVLLACIYDTNESIDEIASKNYSFQYECAMKNIFSQGKKVYECKIGKIKEYL